MERVLITGASRGIGRAVAVRLAKPEREVLLQGRDARALASIAQVVAQRGAVVSCHRADLARPEEVQGLADAVGSRPLTALVNNAGYALVKPTTEISLAEWQSCLAVNLTAPFLLCRALLPRMPAGAVIVNVLSVAAKQGFAGWAAYCAAKFGLEGFSQCLREELRGAGVRVVNVYPSATSTALWDSVPGSWPRERMLAPEEVAEAVAFVVDRPKDVLVSELVIGHPAGRL